MKGVHMKKPNIFETVASKIKNNIDDGTYSQKQKLPSEYDLAKEFDVSRLTVRKAIDLLISQNLLVKQRGKGTYIMKQSDKFQSGQNGLLSFTESAKTFGKTSKSIVINFEIVTNLPDEVKKKLQVENESIYRIKRLRYFDEDPMTIEEIYIRTSFLPKDITEKDIEHSIFSLISEQIDISYSHQEIEAVLVTKELSEYLDVPLGDPLLLVHTVTYAASGIPILYDNSYYRADKYTFKNILHRP